MSEDRETLEELEEQAQKALDHERWLGYVDGKVEGALNVLYDLDLDREKRLDLLARAVGLSRATATDMLRPREIEDRIYKHPNLTNAEKEELLDLMDNEAMLEEKELDHPVETLRLISKMGGGKYIDECIPQVKAWVKSGEGVSMLRVREWIIEKYQLW